jgi:DNA recombination protein RmuC
VTWLLVALAVIAVGLAFGAAAWAGATALRRWIDARLATTDAEMRRVADASFFSERGAGDVRREVADVREALERMLLREEERRDREDESWEVLHRVSAVLAGGQRTGRAGENVLRETLVHLPPSMLERDFRVNGRVVEFGIVLPDGRRLPVDSKWPAERELLALAETDEGTERERLIRLIETTVVKRAKEVSSYRDESMTAPIAVAAVPDAAYAVLRRAHVDAYRQGVIVIPYSMALPVVLFIHAIASRLGEVGDVQGCLTDLAAVLEAMEATLENKLEKASAMLGNGTGELRLQVGKARSSLSRAREVERPPEDGGAEIGVDSGSGLFAVRS